MGKTDVVIYLSNAVDELTKQERAINTDSPAATNKVFALARAIRGVGVRCIVLSLGRGRQNGNGKRHAATVRRLSHGAVLYAEFRQSPWLTHLMSFVSLAWLLVKLIRRHPDLCVLVYNRGYHYLPALLLARILRARCYLDLEDGYIVEGHGGVRHLKNALSQRIYSWLCSSGSMVANTGLAVQLDRPPAMVCYGVASASMEPCQDWNAERLQVLFSGTLIEEVGCEVLLSTLEILRRQYSDMMYKMHFVVTGKGVFSESFRNFANQAPELLSFRGALTRKEYLNVLNSSHVGLSLRLSAYEMGSTTFPSKVVEYAEHGLVLITTRTSDVPMLFENDALYLEDESAEALAKMLISLPRQRESLQNISICGRKRVLRACAPDVVGRGICRMLTQEVAEK